VRVALYYIVYPLNYAVIKSPPVNLAESVDKNRNRLCNTTTSSSVRQHRSSDTFRRDERNTVTTDTREKLLPPLLLEQTTKFSKASQRQTRPVKGGFKLGADQQAKLPSIKTQASGRSFYNQHKPPQPLSQARFPPSDPVQAINSPYHPQFKYPGRRLSHGSLPKGRTRSSQANNQPPH
jgi:hypothetical protein